MRRGYLLLSLLVLPFLTVNCGEISVVRAPASEFASKAQYEVCTEPPLSIGKYSYVLFVVDMSGSNTTTDAGKTRRANAISNFLAQHRNNSFIRWGFIRFQNSTAESYIPEQGGTNRIFTADPTLMDIALSNFMSDQDVGATPYKAALNMSTSAIRAEITASEEIVPNFNVIMLSDGAPTDYGTPPSHANIMQDVENLVSLSPGNIHLSTVYYGPPNPAASNLKRDMADRGRGRFQDTNVDPDLDLSSLIIGQESGEPYKVKYFGVYNLTSAPCFDGTIGPDSDMDGLCDRDEVELNNNPFVLSRTNGQRFDLTNRNSFHPNFSDLIYYRHIMFNEALPLNCENEGDEDFDLLNSCEEQFLMTNDPQGPTDRWTERMVMNGKHADKQNFDSDGDGILDYLEFVWFFDKAAAMNYHSVSQRTNGYRNDVLFENHLNPRNPHSSAPYEPNFRHVRINQFGQNCYSYSQKNLPLYSTQPVNASQTSGYLNLAHGADENIILVYYIQTPEYAPHTKGILRFSYQKLVVNRDGPADLNMEVRNFDIYPHPQFFQPGGE